MGLAYLFSLVVGLGVLLVQLFVAHHADADGDGVDDGPAIDHGLMGAHDHGLAKPGQANDFGLLSLFFSLRFWVFGLFAFGLSGSLLNGFGLARPAVIFLLALAVGLLAGGFAVTILRTLAKTAAPPAPHARAAIGKLGRVIVACGRGRTGQVRITLDGRSVDLLATTDEDAIARGAAVIVDDVVEGTAKVTRAPAEVA